MGGMHASHEIIFLLKSFRKCIVQCNRRDTNTIMFVYLFIYFKFRESDSNNENEANEIERTEHTLKGSPESSTSLVKHQIWPILEGLWLILSSTYLLHVSLFIWLSAVVSSFFYFQVR